MSDGSQEQRDVLARAEEIVDRAADGVGRFARRLVARAREEAEDLWAEAQAVARGGGAEPARSGRAGTQPPQPERAGADPSMARRHRPGPPPATAAYPAAPRPPADPPGTSSDPGPAM